jgi:hypothetical protein
MKGAHDVQAYVDESANRFNYSRNNNGVGYWRVVLGQALGASPMLLTARSEKPV